MAYSKVSENQGKKILGYLFEYYSSRHINTLSASNSKNNFLAEIYPIIKRGMELFYKEKFPNDIDDLTQEVILKLNTYLEKTQFSNINQLLGYTRYTMKSVVANYIKAKRTRPNLLHIDRTKRELPRLPHKTIDLVFKMYLEGKEYREIADRLNIPIGTVESSLNRGKRWLLKDKKFTDYVLN